MDLKDLPPIVFSDEHTGKWDEPRVQISVSTHYLSVGGEKWDDWRAIRDAVKERIRVVITPSAPQSDVRQIIERLGFDPTNHHNAAKCPYCSRDDFDASNAKDWCDRYYALAEILQVPPGVSIPEIAKHRMKQIERLRIENEEIRFSRPHTKDSPQHGDDISLCGRDCEGRA